MLFNTSEIDWPVQSFIHIPEDHCHIVKTSGNSRYYRYYVEYFVITDIVITIMLTERGEFCVQEHWHRVKGEFLTALRNRNSSECLSLAKTYVSNQIDMKNFYLNVISPIMVDIGFMWEKQEITLVDKHTYSEYITRVMSYLYSSFGLLDITKGTAIVAAVANKANEISARIMADLLELDGWEVHYMDAATPLNDMMQCIEAKNPLFFALSVSKPFNAQCAKDMVDGVRSRFTGKKILLGGRMVSRKADIGDYLNTEIDWTQQAENTVNLANGLWDKR